MEEIFKKHPVYTDYEGGNLGTIRSLRRMNPKIMRPSTSPKGYKYFNCAGKTMLVHRFIYECFNGVIPDGYEIDHIDGNPADNSLENLRAVSHRVNINNPITIKHFKEARNNIDKIRVGTYNLENSIITIYPSYREAERVLGVSRETFIRMIEEGLSKPKTPITELAGLYVFPCDISDFNI